MTYTTLMKLFLSPLIIISLGISQWQQDEFMIGCHWDPNFTNDVTQDITALNKYYEAGFNLLTGSSTNNSYWPEVRDVNNQYILERVADFNTSKGYLALRMVVNDEFVRTNPTLPFYGLNRSMSIYTGLTGSMSDALYGYYNTHEPNGVNLEADLNFSLNIASLIKNIDPTRMVFGTLGASWVVDGTANQNWAGYVSHVHAYASDPNTNILNFDYYVLNYKMQTNTIRELPLTTSYFAMPNAEDNTVSFYRHLELFAGEAQKTGKQMWGSFGSSVEEDIIFIDPNTGLSDIRWSVRPTLESLQYYAYSNLIYGAKALLWYVYEKPNDNNDAIFYGTPSSDGSIYNLLKTVNNNVKSMGPTLMKLTWITTVHGSDIDPNSLEQGLPTPNINTPAIGNLALDDNIAIGVFNDKTVNYIMVLNKNLSNTKTQNLLVNGKIVPLVLSQDITKSGTWSKVTGSSYNATTNKTSFSLTLGPTELSLIRLDHGTKSHILKYSLGKDIRF